MRRAASISGLGIGDPVLHGLLLRERPSERLPDGNVPAHEIHRAPRHPEPAHAVLDATRPEPCLGDPEATPPLAEQVCHGHPAVLVAHFAVAPAERRVSHGPHRPETHARPGQRHDEHAEAVVGLGLSQLRPGHDDGERRAHGPRGEPLVTVDHPLIPVEHRRGPEVRRVSTGDLGLGHGKTGANVAGDVRQQIAARLLLGTEHVKDLAVAGIRGLTAEADRTERTPADDLSARPTTPIPMPPTSSGI